MIDSMSSWDRIDDFILRQQTIQALQAICETEGCPLHRAMDLFQERYDLLREARPDDFATPPEEYGRGVYT
jgi:hypothetical protein